jgi:DNA-binding SARP family transcriptional activator
VDAELFEQAAERALAERGPARRRLLEGSARLWLGEPLPDDRYADWARPVRERLEHKHLEVLLALLDEHLGTGTNALAVEVGQRALALDPLHEGVHRALMVAFARAGRRGRALRQYLECRRALVDAMGIEPSAETSLIQRRILAGASV